MKIINFAACPLVHTSTDFRLSSREEFLLHEMSGFEDLHNKEYGTVNVSKNSALLESYGIRTEQYLFNYIYEHKNAEDRKFGDVLPGDEIEFVARFVLISAYLHKLETDMRKAGDHLQKNIRL